MILRKTKRVKLRYDRIAILVLCIVAIIGSIIGIKHYIYINSYEYKFLTKGYDKESTNYLLKLSEKEKKYILTLDYNDYIIDILKEEYFMWKNLDDYLSYYSENNDKSFSDVISIVNVSANKEWYDDDTIKETDISLKEKMLVNKFNYLPDDYDDNINVVKIKNWYAYGDCKILDEVYDSFIEMYDAAKEEGLTLIINSGYRSNKEQKEIYNDYKKYKNQEYADAYAARPGFSEHETGLALDIFTPDYATTSTFENSEEYKWLLENSYKYGFILRYPKDKEYLTGYAYESWHYRYLGKSLAKKVYESGLTYDEYYAYYIGE